MKVEIHRHQSQQPWTYSQLDLRQREIAQALQQGGEPTLLMSELAPVITRGRRTPDSDIQWGQTNSKTPNQISSQTRSGIEVVSVDRGGYATYHGPGQWVCFPVDRLEALTGDTRGVQQVVDSLLDCVATVARQYCSGIEIRKGPHLGVWTPLGKIAAVGVHIERGVLLHGFSVNGFCTPTSFTEIRPCGLEDPVDFLLKQPLEKAFVKLGQELIDATLFKFKK